jgi:hypothetical protein
LSCSQERTWGHHTRSGTRAGCRRSRRLPGAPESDF